jgi:hypothetical protein
VEAPDGTEACAVIPFSKATNTRSVGFPLESRISSAWIAAIFSLISSPPWNTKKAPADVPQELLEKQNPPDSYRKLSTSVGVINPFGRSGGLHHQKLGFYFHSPIETNIQPQTLPGKQDHRTTTTVQGA